VDCNNRVTSKPVLDKRPRTLKVSEMESVQPQQISVLLVEDEDALRNLLTKVLVQSGLKVVAADSGAQALKLWRENRGDFDVLVTDLIMDGMNGFELAEKLEEQKEALSVICVTGYDLDMLQGQLQQHPHYQILQKPFRPRDLAEKIRNTLFLHPLS
jgi:two-component system, cell cycle sensor histidine kinase and response regulator CckA